MHPIIPVLCGSGVLGGWLSRSHQDLIDTILLKTIFKPRCKLCGYKVEWWHLLADICYLRGNREAVFCKHCPSRLEVIRVLSVSDTSWQGDCSDFQFLQQALSVYRSVMSVVTDVNFWKCSIPSRTSTAVKQCPKVTSVDKICLFPF